MRRKLWVLDLALLLTVIATGFLLRQRWNESSRREQALLQRRVPVPVPPAIPGIPGVTPATPANYLEVAQMNLFTPDRNPNVIVDPPPPPPPPPEMPPLPVAYGVLDIGLGPTVILAEKPGAAHKSYQAGEMIGAFKIVAMNSREILFDWDGQPVKKTIEELSERKSAIIASSQADDSRATTVQSPAGSQPTTTAIGGAQGPAEVDQGNRSKACVAGDTTAAGTVKDGFRKVVTKSPFGEVCRWEPVR